MKLTDKNSYLIEREILKLSNTMLLNVSLQEFKMKLKSKETRNYWQMLWLERKPLKKSKKPKDSNEERRLLNSRNIISKLLVTKKHTKN